MRMAEFRGIEQGATLVRHPGNGLSVATDCQGRILAGMDHSQTSGDRPMVAEVPTRGVRTIYSRVGDAFSWLALFAPAGLTVTAIRGA
jgi:apolipoprotein N-acyltransferase